jgi:hypothetical protein
MWIFVAYQQSEQHKSRFFAQRKRAFAQTIHDLLDSAANHAYPFPNLALSKTF